MAFLSTIHRLLYYFTLVLYRLVLQTDRLRREKPLKTSKHSSKTESVSLCLTVPRERVCISTIRKRYILGTPLHFYLSYCIKRLGFRKLHNYVTVKRGKTGEPL